MKFPNITQRRLLIDSGLEKSTVFIPSRTSKEKIQKMRMKIKDYCDELGEYEEFLKSEEKKPHMVGRPRKK